MSAGEHPDPRHRWFPVCSRIDLQPGHVFETDLLARELAVWQGTGGTVNVWENRCPHRGMRLSAGANLGAELRCAYHGYRFAEGSGLCTLVPAQPDRAPPRSLCVKSYPVREAGNLIWTRLADDEPAVDLPPAAPGDSTVLYRVAVNAAPPAVGAVLAGYRFRPSAALGEPETADETCTTSPLDAYSFRSVARKGGMAAEVRLFLQPVDARCTVVHGILIDAIGAEQRIPTLRHHALQITRLRDACERLVGSPNADAAAAAVPEAPLP